MGLTSAMKATACCLVRSQTGRMLGAALAVAGFAAMASAQSPLNTFYAADRVGADGGQLFFDLQVLSPITITQIDVNTQSAAGTVGM